MKRGPKPFRLIPAWIALYAGGALLREVAAAAGKSVSTVHKALRAAGIPTRPNLPKNEDLSKDQALRDFAVGLISLREAQKRLGGVSRQRVFQLVAKAGLALSGTRYHHGFSLTEEEIDQLTSRQITVAFMAERKGVADSTVHQFLRKVGVRLPWQWTKSAATPFRLTDEEVAEMRNGVTRAAMAERKGVSVATISLALRRQQVPKLRDTMRPGFVLSVTDAADLASGKKRIQEVAADHGVSRLTVRAAMWRQGIKAPWEQQ